MKVFFPIILILILSQNSVAEVINGPANIRAEPQKQVFLELYDSVDVRCTELKANWYQIAITIKITEDIYSSGQDIKKGDKLMDWNNKIIGVALTDIPPSCCSPWTSGGAPGNPKRFGMDIFGYTFKDNIYSWSIPENPLNKLILENKNNLNLIAFKKYLSDFKFEQSGLLKDLPTLTEYMIYENDIDDPSPLDRIRVVFENQKLIAIVHSREIDSKQWETVDISRSRKLTIFSLPKNIDKKTFIDLNNKAYMGID